MEAVQFKNNWAETKQRFDAWFRHEKTGRPLMNLWAVRGEADAMAIPEAAYDSCEEQYLSVEKNFQNTLAAYSRLKPMAEAFPQFSMNLGAGSMALYLGAEPVFRPDTVWFSHFLQDYQESLPLRYDENNVWWKRHQDIVRRQVEIARDTDLMVCIPDIIENIDILSSIRDPQTCCFDLYDCPDEVAEALKNISDIYMRYYDAFYDIVKSPDGYAAYTAFSIMGREKTAKIQCDFAALISPGQFDELILPSLRRQCEEIPYTLYHLDGPECLVHVDSLMKIESLKALQWTPGARNPGSGDEQWYPLYTKVRQAGKGLWITLVDYTPDEAVQCADKLVKTFGPEGFYFHFPEMSASEADALLCKAEREWKDS